MSIEGASLCFWLSLSLWVIGFLLSLCALVWRRERLLGTAVVFAALGLAPLTAGIVVRWVATARPPFISLYELVIASAWFAVATYLAAQAAWRAARPVAVAVLPVAFLSLGAALTLSPAANPLSAALKSWWLVVHILFALLGHGCFALAFGAALLLLVRGHDARSSALDEISSRSVVFGFICHTVMILSGSIWANNAWGRFWGWDPIETWSLVTWLLYGLYAHLRLLPRWRGRLAAAYAIAAFLVVVFSFWAVPHLWTSMHDYTFYSR
ncbi:MAG: hypothetical protein FJ291_26305 [Planctomycetes bacterium]|nr:hypothetical protein [Planctomycetota bacterium]